MSVRNDQPYPVEGKLALDRCDSAREAEIGRDCAWICVPRLREGRGAFRLFVEGDELYTAMVTAIEQAERRIRMESFIFAADEVGRRFAAALAAKARMGLDVRLHLDSFGSGLSAFRELQRQLQGAGVQLQWFHPLRLRHPLEYLHRNHRKLLVVDERTAFLGGFNIRRLNSRALHGEMRQRDTHVSVAGELAPMASALFDWLWQGEGQPRAEAIPEDATGVEALLVPSYSRHCRQRLACLHAGLIEDARRRVWLTSPYFGPRTIVARALRTAARRGVDVRLLVPRRGDPPAAGWATRAAYEPLLTAGVRIDEYLSRKLHAKTCVIDDEWAIVGSANLDYLSLFVNQELVLIARDRMLAEALHVQYQRDLDDAAEVIPSVWRGRGWCERGLEACGRAVRWLL